MRLRVCSDIIAFLEDLEKIYRLLRKKGVDANYYLIIGAFSKIADEETGCDGKIFKEPPPMKSMPLSSPLGIAIEKKSWDGSGYPDPAWEMVGFVETFNKLSPDAYLQ